MSDNPKHETIKPRADQGNHRGYSGDDVVYGDNFYPRLTAREKQALKLAASGMQIDRIADYMELSPKTVDAHLGSARKKLGAKNTVNAVAIAIRKGIITALSAVLLVNAMASPNAAIRPRGGGRTPARITRTCRSAQCRWMIQPI